MSNEAEVMNELTENYVLKAWLVDKVMGGRQRGNQILRDGMIDGTRALPKNWFDVLADGTDDFGRLYWTKFFESLGQAGMLFPRGVKVRADQVTKDRVIEFMVEMYATNRVQLVQKCEFEPDVFVTADEAVKMLYKIKAMSLELYHTGVREQARQRRAKLVGKK